MLNLFVTYLSYHFPIATKKFGKFSKSQSSEDKAMYEQFFEGHMNGIFVEMGALDGITYSNTFAYEQILNWRGILIEANPKSCKRLFHNRRNSTTLCTAISKNFTNLTFEYGRYSATFYQPKNINQKYEKLFGTKTRTQISIPSFPLGPLLRMHGIKYIDLFSLDVEGSELDVLDTMDWNIPVRVWCIEWSKDTSILKHNRTIHELLTRHGYHRTSWLHENLDHNQLWVWNKLWDPSKFEWNMFQQ